MAKNKQTPTHEYYEVDVREIKSLNRAGGNIRIDYGNNDGSLEELVKSIKENGIIVPLRAYQEEDGGWVAIDGHRRLTAGMQVFEETGIPVKAKVVSVDGKKVSDDQLIFDMVNTNSGKPLSPMEMSEAVRRLIAYGYKSKEIALKFGKNTHFVNNLALLASAPKIMRDLVSENKMGHTLVLDLLKESPDFNAAVEKIKIALGAAKAERVKKGKEEGFEVSEETYEKVTKRHLDIAHNRVNSFKELEGVIRWALEEGKDAKNEELTLFAKKLVNNNLTGSEIKQLLFT